MTEILEKLAQIEEQEQVRILYALDCGSRAQGTTSEHSDHDLRFIYVRPLAEYLRFEERKDTMTPEQNETWDIAGWDLKKALMMARKSNIALYEWLSSPLVYREEDCWRALRPLLESCFRPGPAAMQNLADAKGNLTLLQGRTLPPKIYIRALRPVLRGMWTLERQTPPPLELEPLLELVPQEHLAFVREVLYRKRTAPDTPIPRTPQLEAWLRETLDTIPTRAKALMGRPQPETAPLEEAFQKIVLEEQAHWERN